MTYEEYENNIKKRFNNSINTKDEKMRFKIMQSLNIWYQKKYAKDVKKAFEIADVATLKSINDEIEYVCMQSDYLKVKLTYNDKFYNFSNEISLHIFSLLKESIDNNEYVLTQEQYDNFVSQLNQYKPKISILFKEEFDYLFSECLLDLNYLLNKGNVNAISFRASHYLDENIARKQQNNN